MSGARFHCEDGPEDTSARAGRPDYCEPSGSNGSFVPYVHQHREATLPTPEQRRALMDLRLAVLARYEARQKDNR